MAPFCNGSSDGILLKNKDVEHGYKVNLEMN